MTDPAFSFVINYVRHTVEMVLERGINHGNEMELRWAAARGPWPEDFQLEKNLFLGMKGAFYVLVELSERALEGKLVDEGACFKLQGNIRSDLDNILSPAWTGIHGWQD